MHRAVSVEGGYFLPLISTAAGLGCCRLAVDKDAVCGKGLGVVGMAAWVQEPDPSLHPQGLSSEICIYRFVIRLNSTLLCIIVVRS